MPEKTLLFPLKNFQEILPTFRLTTLEIAKPLIADECAIPSLPLVSSSGINRMDGIAIA